MNGADFWNDQEKAQKVIGEYKLLKAQTEGLETILISGFDVKSDHVGSLEDVMVGYELAKEAGDEELLTEEEAIRYLRLDIDGPAKPSLTLRYYREKGLLRATRVGRRLRYRRVELDRLLECLTEEN